MLLPVVAVAGWIAVALVVTLLVGYVRKYWMAWCGLGIAACGAIYYPSMMAIRPPYYYAILEGLASAVAIGSGFIMAVVGVSWGLSAEPSRYPTNKHAEPSAAPDPEGK